MKNKKFILLLITVVLFISFTSCLNDNKQKREEKALIQEYLNTSKLEFEL